MSTTASVAVVHGNMLARGGGEVVAEELARAFDAPLYYGFGDDDVPADDVDARSLCNTSILNRWNGSKLVRDGFYWWEFDHIPELYQYDVIIQSGNEFGWYVPQPEQIVIRYLHSTPRTPYDRYDERGSHLKEKLYSKLARQLYAPTMAYPDRFVANSEVIQRRAERYFGIEDTEVVYPPVETTAYPTAAETSEDYYLTLSRLFPAKRIDLIVEAFTELGIPLKIAGSGPDRDLLEAKAGPNIEFLGYVSEAEKRSLLARACAFVFAARAEDFGIVPVEAMAAGTPVLGVAEGFTEYQVVPGGNGLRFTASSRSLQEAVEEFEDNGVAWSPREIQEFAGQFSTENFHRKMHGIVETAIEAGSVDPDLQLPITDIPDPSVEHRLSADGGHSG